MKQPAKKPYEKPAITQVPLKAEEAVLTACKNAPGGGSHIQCGGIGNPTFDFGS
jgi:hypothetical protein